MANENGEKKVRPRTRIPKVLGNKKVQEYIHNYYAMEGKDNYPSIAMARWRKETHYPPVEVLIGIARTLRTNVSYILSLTEVNCPCDYDKAPEERTLQDLLDVQNMSKKELISALDSNYKAVYRYEEELPKKKVYSLIKLAEALHVSVDYILGYTNWESWEPRSQIDRPFSNIKAGSGAYIVADKGIQSVEDINRAIRRGDGKFCLLSEDGEYVIFPNGNKIRANDDVFLGAYVARVIPEVK